MGGSSIPSSFRFKLAATGCGVRSPVTFKVPVSLIFVSSATLSGLARYRLAPVTFTDNGASSTFAAGRVRRSSAEILASRSANSPSSKCQAGTGPAAGGMAGVAGGAAAGGGGGGRGGGGGGGQRGGGRGPP